MSEYLYASIKPKSPRVAKTLLVRAYFRVCGSSLNNIPEQIANGSMVRNNDVEKSAKNAHEDLPLLLQRKCHKLCMAIEAAINKNAVQLI